MKNKLVGKWIADTNDKATIENYGNISLQFTDDDRLIYTIDENEKKQKIFLFYKIKNNYLITDQPSKPQEEITKFEIFPDGKLLLFFDGVESKYIKVE